MNQNVLWILSASVKSVGSGNLNRIDKAVGARKKAPAEDKQSKGKFDNADSPSPYHLVSK